MSEFMKDSVKMQKEYQSLVDTNSLTKRNMCNCCIPFRDKYHLTDLQTLRIARKEMSLEEMVEIEEAK